MISRQRVRRLAALLLLASFAALAGGCSRQQAPKKQLLIYCGITMIRPMAEIARDAQRIVEYLPRDADAQEFAQLATAAIELKATQ